jgi:hypothetical protein
MEEVSETENLPSQLRIGYEVIPRLAHIREEGFGIFAHKTIRDGSDGLANLWTAEYIIWGHVLETHDIVSSPDCECHSVSHEIRIGEQRDVCVRIIAIDVPASVYQNEEDRSGS